MPTKILIVDDQTSVRRMLEDYLSGHGFQVMTSSNGEDALFMARHKRPDVILLDIMMPRMDGYEFIRQFRLERKTPIIFVTARREETDAVLGLELGGDDYITKPFRMRELMARIRAVLRRCEEVPEKIEIFQSGDIVIDERTHTVTVKENLVSLTPIEFALLSIFIRTPGKVFTRSELVDLLINGHYAGLDRTLNVHIRNLRMKIEPDPANPYHIETVFGVGYRFRKDE